MPVALKQHINASLDIEIWHFTESEAFFLSALPLSDQQKQEIWQLSLPKRRLEKLACRMALYDLMKNQRFPLSLEQLQYSNYGAPQLPPYNISFSHCKQYAAAALASDIAVGIDIEPIGTRILKLYHSFLNEDEVQTCNFQSPEELHYYWGAKEAIFKAYGQSTSMIFKDIHIYPKEKTGDITVNGETSHYQLINFMIEGNMVVVAFTTPLPA